VFEGQSYPLVPGQAACILRPPAREFFGLPDVQPMQAAMMEQVQAKMMANMDQFSPETLLHNWFTFDPKMAERFGEMFVNMTGLTSGGRSKEKK
jgi:hypothetical protein